MTTPQPPSGRRFDIHNPPELVLPEQTLPQGRVHQAVAYDHAHGWMYVTQIISDNRQLPDEPAPVSGTVREQRGDLCITRCEMDGTVLGSMFVRGAGHGWSLSVEPVGADTYVWMETAAARDGTYGWGTKTGRILWVKDLVLDSGDPEIDVYDPVPGMRRVNTSIDWTTGRVIVCYRAADGGFRYNLYLLADFRNKAFVPYQSLAAPPPAAQNFIMWGDYIYQLSGHAYSDSNPPPGDTYIQIVSALDGRVVDNLFVTYNADLSHREPESFSIRLDGPAPRLVLGWATREPGPRRITLYAFDLVPLTPPPPLPGIPPAVGVLGCAESYQAAIFHRGGARVWIPASRLTDAVTAVQWERRLNDTATARVVIVKQQLSPACCADFGNVEPWCHELGIYRDGEMVWQGPVLRSTEEADSITIDALDVTAWLAKLVNTKSTYYRDQAPQGIASTMIRQNLLDATLATPAVDWPNMVQYIRTYVDGPPTGPGEVPYPVTVWRPRSIWTDTLMTVLNDQADRGFEWTTIGRMLMMRPSRSEKKHRARARLTPDHLPGGISVIKDGDDAATRVFASSQTENEPGITVSVAVPKAKATCGRLDMLVKDNPRIEIESDVQKQARINALRKARDRKEDVADDLYDAKTKARRAAANAELKRIAALPDSVCNRKCKDDASDDERDARDADIQAYRKERDKTKQAARDAYERDVDASNAAVEKRRLAEVRKQLTALARQTLAGRWPVPTVISVQSNARLSSAAPILVRDLVCGERIDVATIGYCREVTQAMKLSAVRGTWDQRGEEIAVSLTPLTPLVGD